MTTPRPDFTAEPADPAGTPASAIAQSLEALAGWRAQLERHVVQLGRALADQDLLDDGDNAVLAGLRDRLASDKLVLAFVATLYPSWRASRVNPAEALRYE